MIIQANIGEQPYFYCGSSREPEWSTDRKHAADYASDSAARADVAKTSPVFAHYLAGAQVVPA